MTIIGDIAIFLWGPLVIALFGVLPPRRAVIVSYITGWLFLPVTSFVIVGLPDYSKTSATSICVLLGSMIFDVGRVTRYRFRNYDLPMLLWCLCPFASSVSNGLGVYDGISGVVANIIEWGLPYFIGRVYFNDAQSLKELAVGIFIGGLVYVPLCLYEVRMSPQLHIMLYGYHQHSWIQTLRFGGYRPTVFMEHGLMVGSWMAAASLVGIWMWHTGALKQFKSVPIVALLAPLVVTTVLCKSIGALVLMFAGLAALQLSRAMRTGIWIALLLAVPPVYIAARTTGIWDGTDAVSMAGRMFGEDRAKSLRARLDNESLVIQRALRQPVFGWGAWGRSDVRDFRGRGTVVYDGLWMIVLGKYGLLGVISLFTTLLISPARLLLKWGRQRWKQTSLAPASALIVVVILFAIDCLLNAMIIPVFILCCGALAQLPHASRVRQVVSAGEEAEERPTAGISQRRLWPQPR